LLVVGQLYADYKSSEQEALTATDNLAAIIETNISSSLRRAERDLNSFAHFLQSDDLAGTMTDRRRSEVMSLLSDHLVDSRLVGHYRVLDENGTAVVGAGSPMENRNVADSEWFKTLKNNPERRYEFSEVQVDKPMQRPTLILAVPIRGAGRQFSGIVEAVLDLENFQRLINTPDIGPHGLITIRRIDTTELVVRRPRKDSLIGKPVETVLTGRMANGDAAGSGQLKFPADGEFRTYSFRRIQGFPLAVVVALARRDFMASWETQALILGAVAILSAFTLWALYAFQVRTHRKLIQSSQRVAESERRYHGLFDVLPNGVLIRCADGTVLDANESACRILHQNRSNVVGKSNNAELWGAVYEDGSPLPEDQLPSRQSMATGISIHDFIMGVGDKDDRRWISVNSQPLFKESEPLPYAVISSFTDITARKRMEKQLGDSEERYRMTFEQAAMGIAHVGFDGAYLRYNSKFAEIVGYPMEEIKSLTYDKVTLPEDRHETAAAMQALRSNARKSVSVEKRYVRKDGTLTWVRVTASVQHDGDGNPLHFTSLVEDINDLKAAQFELAGQRVRMELILSSAGEGIVGIDANERIMFMNKAAREMLGWEDSEGIGLSLHDHSHACRADGTANPKADCAVYKTIKDGQTRTVTDEVFWRRNGTSFPVEFTVAAIREDAVIIGSVVVFHDITERVRLTNHLQQLAETDPLTKLANRRAFTAAADAEFNRCKRFNSPAALLMIDIDHFKEVNDCHGHEAGDRALIAMASILNKSVRTTDTAARYGGEEFVLLLVETDLSGAIDMAERIRTSVSRVSVESDSGSFGFTVSVGVSVLSSGDEGWTQALNRADEGMYRAKHHGRNRVEYIDPIIRDAM